MIHEIASSVETSSAEGSRSESPPRSKKSSSKKSSKRSSKVDEWVKSTRVDYKHFGSKKSSRRFSKNSSRDRESYRQHSRKNWDYGSDANDDFSRSSLSRRADEDRRSFREELAMERKRLNNHEGDSTAGSESSEKPKSRKCPKLSSKKPRSRGWYDLNRYFFKYKFLKLFLLFNVL